MTNFPEGDPRHGRSVGYRAGCRCDECSAYQRESNRRSALNRKIKQVRRDADFASPYGNGSSTACASGLTWHVATFHVPNPDVWDDQTVTVETTLPVGPFNVTLACQAGAAQVDVWLAGYEDAYVADTTLDCVTPCYLDFAVPVPDAVPSVSERHDDAPCGGGSPQLGAPSGQTGPDISTPVLSAAIDTTPTTPPPVGVASSAAETTVAPSTVVSAAAATTLPNTGFTSALWWRLGLLLSVVGLLIVICTWHTGRKVNGR